MAQQIVEHLGEPLLLNVEQVRHVVEEDRRLEQLASGATRELMQHRWHWTLDESNPQRLSLNAYAQHVGRSYTTIARNARGYQLLLTNERARARGYTVHGITPSDATELAGMGEETRAVTEAVAQARGISAVNTRQHHGDQVRRTREVARERAEDRGTSVVQEAPQAAQDIVSEERARAERLERYEREEQAEREERERRLGLRFLQADAKLVAARRDLREAAQVLDGLELNDEMRALLAASIDKTRRMLDVMDQASVGVFDGDWGEKLRIIEGGR